MHIDGIEGIHIALYEVSPCKTNGILLAKNLLHFLDILCEFRWGKTSNTLGVTFYCMLLGLPPS